MCQYCGCQEIETLGRLMDDHVQIRNYCGQAHRDLQAGNPDAAVRELRQIQRILATHNAVEERGLYLAMTRFGEYAEQAGELYNEHDDVDDLFSHSLALADRGHSDRIDWEAILAAFGVLKEHIQREDNGLFPAAAVALDATDWELCEQIRAGCEAASGGEN